MRMVADLADRTNVIDDERTMAEGDPDVVLPDPGVMAAYLGLAASGQSDNLAK